MASSYGEREIVRINMQKRIVSKLNILNIMTCISRISIHCRSIGRSVRFGLVWLVCRLIQFNSQFNLIYMLFYSLYSQYSYIIYERYRRQYILLYLRLSLKDDASQLSLSLSLYLYLYLYLILVSL
jgi:hypothetical protein